MIKYIVIDLEATCWEDKSDSIIKKMEIIEIGAVCLHEFSFDVVNRFSVFIKPKSNPVLSSFCTSLTSITQSQINDAPGFSKAYQDFLKWIGNDSFYLLSWGAFDWQLLEQECQNIGISFPPENCLGHINIKEIFAYYYNTKSSVGFKTALNKVGIKFEGRPHRGVDDAYNIAKVAQILKPLISK